MENILEQLKNAPRTRAKLSDFIKIKHGYAFKGEHFSAQPTKDVLVTPGNFAIGGGFKAEKYKYYAGPVPEDYVLGVGDLVVTMTDLSVNADTLGYSALIPKVDGVRFLHNQRVGLVQKIKDGIDMNFLYFLMRTREYQSYVVGGASGSTVKHTSPDRIASFEYDFPPIDLQEKVGRILQVYEEKVENNDSTIKNLEEAAQAVFDEWFVKFRFPGRENVKMVESEMGEIPENWSVNKISDIARVTLGGTPSRDVAEYWNGNIAWINSGEVNNLRVTKATEFITTKGLNDSNARLMDVGTVLIAITGATLGQVSRLEIEATANQSVVGVYSGDNKLNEYLYLYIKAKILDLISGASGGAQQHINKKMVEDYLVFIPDNEPLESFHKRIGSIFELLREALFENESLRASRDQLLAKLI